MPKKLTKEEFIIKSNKIHNNLYSYDKVVYKNNSTKVNIKCIEHNEYFEQLPLNHLKGQGCPKCGRLKNTKSTTKTTEQFIIEAKKVYGDKYNYSLTKYKGVHSKVEIVCKEHGIFKQTPRNHLSNHGCNSCAKESREGSWNAISWKNQANKSDNFKGYKLYLIKCFNSKEYFYKVGITFKDLSDRFKTIPYECKIEYVIKSNIAEDIFNLEKIIKNTTRKHKYIPKLKFNGSVQECFKVMDENIINLIKSYE